MIEGRSNRLFTMSVFDLLREGNVESLYIYIYIYIYG